jgi:hypothetical protein
MPLTIKLETVVYAIFYLALIAVLIVPLQKLINSPTAFEEIQLGNKLDLPSITICPMPWKNDNPAEIKDFNDAHVAIEKTKKEYLAHMTWAKPYHKL